MKTKPDQYKPVIFNKNIKLNKKNVLEPVFIQILFIITYTYIYLKMTELCIK